MRAKDLCRVGLGAVTLFFAATMPMRAGEKATEDRTVSLSLGELEAGSEASADDGMGQSRFGPDEDDTYTDDSGSLDDPAKSKFKDEKDEDDQGTDDEGNP